MYFQESSEIQADGLQTLYLMNPNNYTAAAGYSDAAAQQQQPQPAAANMLILNYPTTSTLNFASLSSGQQQNQHHLVGVPLHQSARNMASQDDLKLNRPSLLLAQSEVVLPTATRPPGSVPNFHQSLWNSLLDQNGAGGAQSNIPSGIASHSSGMAVDVGFHRPVVSPTQTQQGLSLSLSPQLPGYNNRSIPNLVDHSTIPVLTTPHQVGNLISPRTVGHLRGSGGGAGSSSSVSNGLPGFQSAVLGSKYLKAAQELLDELVSVGKGIKSTADSTEKGKEKAKIYKSTVLTAIGEPSSINSQSEIKGIAGAAELTNAQKQEIQMKKAKLLNMLEEVEQRYRQYHHQMQIVVASFEQTTGIGSARSYTQLALQTISKQFRCLKDAITAQIKVANKSLGEEEKIDQGSRLKFVDQQLRQQRAMQHLGMMQNNNAWRPQRGLPERAVSVLRAWLFEHFLHPYPKDSDKQMLAKQTGLTRSQVSNWFINARVRLWKPMVEEMYTEEIKNQEEDHNSESSKDSGSKSTTPKANSSATRMDQNNYNQFQSKQEKLTITSQQQDASPAEISNSTASISPPVNSPPARAGFGLVCGLNMDGNTEKSPKKMRSSATHDHIQNSPSSILSVDMDLKFREARKGFTSNTAGNRHGNEFGAFSMGELGQFNAEQLTAASGFHGNGVSLTLGLPPSDQNLLLSGTQQNFLSDHQNMELGSRLEMGTVEGHYNDRVSKAQNGYESIDFESRKGFSAQLLPDFVA